MAAFTAKDVAALREKTGCGMMDCKKALTDAEGNMEKAIDLLREKGLATAAKKAGRIAAEGIVKASQLIDLNVPIVVRLEGTNVEEGREILKNANVPGLIMAESMEQGAQKIVELVKNA